MPYYPTYTPYYQGQPVNLPVNQPAQPMNQTVPPSGQQIMAQPPNVPQGIASPPVQAQSGGNIIVRPVASIEEAKAVPTDFTGAMTILTDFSHGAIYTKVLNYQDGTAVFNRYRLDNTPLIPQASGQPGTDYVPREEFDALKADFQRLNERISGYANTNEQSDHAVNPNTRKRREPRTDDTNNGAE